MGMLDSFLETRLSDIADLPTYAIPPNGHYRLFVKKVDLAKSVTTKKGPEEIIDIGYVVKEILELSDPAAEAAKPEAEKVKIDQEFNESFFFGNNAKLTLEVLKDRFAEVAEYLNVDDLKETLTQLEGMEIFATVKQRKNKDDADIVYAQVKNIKVA